MTLFHNYTTPARCYHGVSIAVPCAQCAAEGYKRCPHCGRLFFPARANQVYCDIPRRVCLQKAAHQRERARAQEGGWHDRPMREN